MNSSDRSSFLSRLFPPLNRNGESKSADKPASFISRRDQGIMADAVLSELVKTGLEQRDTANVRFSFSSNPAAGLGVLGEEMVITFKPFRDTLHEGLSEKSVDAVAAFAACLKMASKSSPRPCEMRGHSQGEDGGVSIVLSGTKEAIVRTLNQAISSPEHKIAFSPMTR